MRLQRWVASLQRSDVFATVGCTAVPRRGAHRAPVYPRCYNNPSSGRAKGHRGDRKAPISNRRQGRKALTGEAPDLPLRGRGTARRRWKELADGGRSSYPMRKKAFAPAVLSKKPFSNFICFICIICPTHIRHMMFFSLFSSDCFLFSQTKPPEKTTFPVIPLSPSP